MRLLSVKAYVTPDFIREILTLEVIEYHPESQKYSHINIVNKYYKKPSVEIEQTQDAIRINLISPYGVLFTAYRIDDDNASQIGEVVTNSLEEGLNRIDTQVKNGYVLVWAKDKNNIFLQSKGKNNYKERLFSVVE